MKIASIFLISALLAFGAIQQFHHHPHLPENNPLRGQQASDRFSIMTYNVENLFDSRHDKGKWDYPFLPLAEKDNLILHQFCLGQTELSRQHECLERDWNPAVVHRKLQAVAQSIQQVHGQGPDILILQEVENAAILHRLNREFLPTSNYQTEVLIEGDDPRGIDVAILSRFPLVGSPKLHHRPHTRGLLEVTLKLPNGEPLTVIGFHLPSQSHPIKARLEGLAELRTIIEGRPAELIIAAGDSNMIAAESSELRQTVQGLGGISHWLGCRECAGTESFYGMWSFLDWILFGQTLLQNPRYQVIPESILTPIWGPGQTTRQGRPIPFKDECRSRCLGVSDHLPVYAEIAIH